MDLTPGTRGMMSGLGRGLTNVANMWTQKSMREQEQERRLTFRREELASQKADMERQRDLEEMRQTMNFVNMAIKSRDEGLMKIALDKYNNTVKEDDPKLDMSMFITEGKEKEILTTISNLNKQFEETGDIEMFRQGLYGVKTGLNKQYNDQELAIVDKELGRLTSIETQRRQTRERRQGLIDTGEVRPRSELTTGELGQPDVRVIPGALGGSQLWARQDEPTVTPRFELGGKQYFGKAPKVIETPEEKLRRGKELKAAPGPETERELSDFKWAYAIASKKDPTLTPADFRQKHWLAPKGELSEQAVVRSIDELSYMTADPNFRANAYDDYLGYRKQGMSREEAFNKVRLDTQEKETKVIPGKGTFEKQRDGSWERIE